MNQCDLGVKINRTINGFSLCQSHYNEKMLKKFDCFNVVPVRTPYHPDIAYVVSRLSRYTHNPSSEH